MTSSFHLKLPQQIVFGPGKFSALKNFIPSFGTKPLVILGNSSFSATSNYAILRQMFSSLGIQLLSVNIGSEPSPEIIDEITTAMQKKGIDLIIAIGGGSTLDAGKAISAMLVEGGKVTRFLEGIGTKQPGGNKLPFIAIPTTSGTGSETTSNAVISKMGSNGFKKSLRHDNYIPDLALVDPRLTLSCPQKLTATCGMDCFTQLIEGYLSTMASSLTDAMALDGIKAVNRSLYKAYTDGDDLEARSDLAYGTMLSGIVLANSGLGTVHGLAGAIGGLHPVPHGVICGTLMAIVNKQTLLELRKRSTNTTALYKYTKLGQVCSTKPAESDSWYQDFFIDNLEQMTHQLHIPRLNKYGITPAEIEAIVTSSSNKNNPVQFDLEQLGKIIQARV